MTHLKNELLQKAIQFASVKHAGQNRKSWDIPYIFHPFEVAYQLGKLGITDENTLCGAVLHDTLEDTPTTVQELIDNFGQDITDLVKELSYLDSYQTEFAYSKEEYIESFGEVDDTHIASLVIKLADRTCNIHDCLAAGKNKWAKNMFAKGKVLWDFVEARKSEIEDFYGKVVTSNILWWARKKLKKFKEL